MTIFELIFERINERRNYLLQEIPHNDSMRDKHKETYKYLNYVNHFFILPSTITHCASVTSLIVVPVGIRSSAVRLKICAITAEIKKHKSVLNKRRRSMIK